MVLEQRFRRNGTAGPLFREPAVALFNLAPTRRHYRTAMLAGDVAVMVKSVPEPSSRLSRPWSTTVPAPAPAPTPAPIAAPDPPPAIAPITAPRIAPMPARVTVRLVWLLSRTIPSL